MKPGGVKRCQIDSWPQLERCFLALGLLDKPGQVVGSLGQKLIDQVKRRGTSPRVGRLVVGAQDQLADVAGMSRGPRSDRGNLAAEGIDETPGRSQDQLVDALGALF